MHAAHYVPQGPATVTIAAITGTYFVCLKCGKEFAYDWDNMRVIDPEPSRVKVPAEKATHMYAVSNQQSKS